MNEYKIEFYINSLNHKRPVEKFLRSLSEEAQSKINKYIEFLRVNDGYIDEPYSRHILGKIRELRVDFKHIRHRIFYFTFIGKKIIILHGFVKKSVKTPPREINIALQNYNDVIFHPFLYEQ